MNGDDLAADGPRDTADADMQFYHERRRDAPWCAPVL
jgi:hypothetical protein